MLFDIPFDIESSVKSSVVNLIPKPEEYSETDSINLLHKDCIRLLPLL